LEDGAAGAAEANAEMHRLAQPIAAPERALLIQKYSDAILAALPHDQGADPAKSREEALRTA
jgi:hypothetical protein